MAYMICKVDGCERSAMYSGKELCQMHYFRFMRNGTFETVKKRNYRSRNGKGYQLLSEPTHPLAHSSGYVYEHRMVYHDQINNDPKSCELCGKDISWLDCHIDHKDNDITNNKKENLRATCRACNTFRGHSPDSMTKNPIVINGVSMSAQAWSRVDGVIVSGATIINRIRSGMSNYDAVFSQKTTHKSSSPSKSSKRTDRN